MFRKLNRGKEPVRLSTTSLIMDMDTWKDDYEENDLFWIMGIVQLENPPKNKNAKVKLMKEFEWYWQV